MLELQERVNTLQWVHRIDLGHGVITPGQWGDGNPAIDRAFDGLDFKGKKVLDIGCWDGKYSFEAEKRGASAVYATDLISQRSYMLPTFELAKEVLNSRVQYFPHVSVYDVETALGVTDFDIVIFCGVYYHLKDPVRALGCLRRVMADGGRLIVEGAVLKSPPGTPAAWDCYARFYYNQKFCGDDSNWWVPTPACLRDWVECNYFEIETDHGLTWPEIENTRSTLTAKAVRRKDPVYIRPDHDLAQFESD